MSVEIRSELLDELEPVDGQYRIFRLPLEDEDGDLDFGEPILFTCRMEASVLGTGTQLWRSSVFLAEFLISQPQSLSNRHVFEVGSGVGFIPIALSNLNMASITASDSWPNSVDLCESNMLLNRLNSVQTMLFDWKDYLEGAKSLVCDVLLASDVLLDYSDVEEFVQVLEKLNKPAYVSMEKRWNILLEDVLVSGSMEPTANIYSHFCQHLSLSKLSFNEIDCSKVPQIYQYTRSNDLVVFAINCL